MLQTGQQIELPELAAALDLNGSAFRIVTLIQGGMGLCAEAQHLSSAKRIALKLVLPDGQASSLSFKRFVSGGGQALERRV